MEFGYSDLLRHQDGKSSKSGVISKLIGGLKKRGAGAGKGGGVEMKEAGKPSPKSSISNGSQSPTHSDRSTHDEEAELANGEDHSEETVIDMEKEALDLQDDSPKEKDEAEHADDEIPLKDISTPNGTPAKVISLHACQKPK